MFGYRNVRNGTEQSDVNFIVNCCSCACLFGGFLDVYDFLQNCTVNVFGKTQYFRYLLIGVHVLCACVVTALVSNICVLSNAVLVKAALPECRVAVNEALTRSFDPALHAKAMDVLRGVQIDVLGGGDADAH